MTDGEWQGQREKGLCFQCDEKYTSSHQCKNRKLKILLVQKDEGNGKVEGETAAEGSPWEMADSVELSLNSVVDNSKYDEAARNTGFEGSGGTDCGATHNFLSLKLIRQLEIPTTATLNYGVVIGIGVAVQGNGICKGVVLQRNIYLLS